MKKTIWTAAAVVLFLLFHLLINYFALSSIAKIRIIAESGQDSQIKTYYSSNLSIYPFSEKRSIKSHWLIRGNKSTRSLDFHNRIARHIRIDPIQNEGSIKIYTIRILSYFGNSIYFDAEEILRSFSVSSSATMALHNGYVEIKSVGPDPQLILKNPVKFHNPLFSLILPFFLSILSTLVLKNVSITQIYAIKDITDKKPSSTQNIIALDGLRGFAALLVITDHAGYEHFNGLGAIGVWIFFCLSGFLLSIPFVKNPSLITSSSYLQHYLFRRINRIVPMYYFILTIVYLFRGKLDNFVRHIIFIQGDGIFWSVPQEMFFYMILPIVFFLNYYLWRGNIKLMLVFTLIMTILLNHYLSNDWLYIYGNGRKLPLYVGVFMSGVCLSYFYHSPYAKFITMRPKQFHDVCGISILVIVLLSTNSFLDLIFNKGINYSWNTEIYGYVAALLLFFTVSHENSLLSRLMSLYPFRAVGIVGFSFYLIHAAALRAIESITLGLSGQEPSHFVLLTVGIVVTYFFSMITYSLIERPFIHKSIAVSYIDG